MDDISKLVVSVSSNGISSTTSDLAALTTASVAAEGATTKLGTAAVTAAQLTKAHSDALKLKTAMQNQDVMVMNLAGKAYADAQKEAISLNNAIDTSAKAYANAQAAAIKMNASYDAAAASSKALAASSLEVAAASDAATKGHGSQATIIRESLVLAHEAATDSGKRFAGSMMVLANATGVANDAMSFSKGVVGGLAEVFEVSVGVVLGVFASIGAAVGVVALAMFQGQKDQKAFADSLLISGNYAGTTTQGLRDMAAAAVVGGGSISEANSTVQKLAATGKFTADEIAGISKAAIGMERAFGVPIDTTIADFEKLSTMSVKSTAASRDAIVKAALEIDAKYHILTTSQFAAIEQASKLGDMEKAVAEADKALFEGLAQRAAESEKNLGTLVRGWHDVTDAISGAWSAMKKWGAAPDPSSTGALDKLKSELSSAQGANKGRGGAVVGDYTAKEKARIDGLTQAVALEQKRLDAVNAVGVAQGKNDKIVQDGNMAYQATLDFDRKRVKDYELTNALAIEANNNAKALAAIQNAPDKTDPHITAMSETYTDAKIAERVAAIHKMYDVKQKGIDDSVGQRQLELEYVKAHYAAMQREDAANIASSLANADKLGGNQEEELAKREIIYNKELDDLKAKTAEQQAIYDKFNQNGGGGGTKKAHTADEVAALKALTAAQAAQGVVEAQQAADEDTVAGKEVARHAAAMKALQVEGVDKTENFALELKAGQAFLDNEDKKNVAIGNSKSAEIAYEAAVLTAKRANLVFTVAQMEANLALDTRAGTQAANERTEMAQRIANGKLLINQDAERIKSLEDQSVAQKAVETAMYNTKQVDEALASGKRFATEMTAAFGSVGTAIGGMSTAILQFGKDQDTAQQQYTSNIKAGMDQGTAQAALDKANTDAALTSYANMTQAAQGMFAKGSAGYKVMGDASKIFHVAEAVMQASTLAKQLSGIATSLMNFLGFTADKDAATITSGGIAVATDQLTTASAEATIPGNIAAGGAQMFAQSGWGGFVGVAAMVAAMAALGYASSAGDGGGNGSGISAATAQQTQGTGTVLGDSTKQSDSIAASLTLMTTNSSAMLPLTQQMASSLKAMETGITGVATLISGNSTAIANGANMGITTGKSSTGLMGDIFGSTSTTIGNAGLQFGNTSVGNLQNGTGVNGQGVQQFAVQNTDSKGFLGFGGSNSSATLTQAVSDGVVQQFALVFQNLQTTLSTAATSLGTDGEAVGKAIQAVVLPTTQISLMGLTTAQQITAINAVLSSTMDVITSEVMPNLTAFAQMGEGPFQTVVRVASGIEQATVALNAFGISAINYTSIVNKQGDVGAEIVRQSIDLVETTQEGVLTGVGKIISLATGAATDLATLYQSLLTIQTLMGDAAMNGENLNQDTISGAGGISQLNAALTTYSTKYFTTAQQLAAQTEDMTAQFAKLGDALPATRDDFVALVNAAEAAGNQTLVGQLLVLSNGFDTLQTSMGNASSVLSNTDVAFQALSASVASAQTDLTAQHTANLAAITASAGPQAAALQATYMSRQIEMMQYQGQLAASLTVANQAVTDINSSISTFTSILGTLDAAITSTSVVSQADARKQAMATLKTASTSGDISGVVGLPDAITNVQAQSDNLYGTLAEYQKSQAEANNYLVLIKANGTTQLTSAQSQLIALQAVVTAIQAQQTAIASDISGMSDADTAAVAASTKVQTDAENANYTAQQASLANILSTAQAQLDAINGVDTSVQSVAAAMAGFAGAVSSQTALKVVGGTATAAAVVAAAPDNTAGGYTQASLTSQLNAWYNAVPSFDVGTNVIPSDMLAKVHKGERIIPAADNVALMNKLNGPAANDAAVTKSNDILSAKLDNLIQVIQVGDTANVKSNNIVAGIVKRWENVGMPPVRSAV